MIDLDAIAKEEKELEEKLFGTPAETEDQSAAAASEDQEQKKTPAKEEELVPPTPEPATDELDKHKREAEEDWEKRYKNLRASRDTKLGEAKRQLTAALETIQHLQQKIDSQNEELLKLKADSNPLEGVFTPEDLEILGDNTADVMQRAIKKSTEVATADLREQVRIEQERNRKRQEAELQRARQSEYNSFLTRVGQIVPDAAEVNKDPGFYKFCHETHDIDGTLIAENFAAAERRLDATTIARYMMQYKQQKAVPKANPLEKKVTPVGRSNGSVPTKEKAPDIMSRAEINKFYDDLSRGRYVGRKSEADAIEKRIEAAMMRGHVR